MADIGGSFCGYGATQVWQDFYLWEHLLNENPQLVGIVELGTAYGGFSVYLHTQAKYRAIEFATFDSIDHQYDSVDRLFGRPASRHPTPNLIALGFQQVELIKHGEAPGVLRCLDHGPVALFCDNGNKAQEVAIYSPYLHPDSLCVVHDWEREIFPADIPGHLCEVYAELCNELKSWSRVFKPC